MKTIIWMVRIKNTKTGKISKRFGIGIMGEILSQAFQSVEDSTPIENLPDKWEIEIEKWAEGENIHL